MTPAPIEKYIPLAYQQAISSSSYPRHSQKSTDAKREREKKSISSPKPRIFFFGRSPLFVPYSAFPARPQASRCWIGLGFRPLKTPRRRIWHPIFRPRSEAARDAVEVARGLLALMRLMKGRWALVEIPWSRTIGGSFFFCVG